MTHLRSAALHNSGLKWISFPFDLSGNEDSDDAAGLYLNYLELKDFLILPVFDKDTDNEAVKKAKEIFSDKKVITIQGNEPAKDTGIINCLTWNIKK
ncbi:agmatine deiminase family protein [Aquiflexum sp. TKW24L]|uniref:agmatine deiminase family protein n=1 Tax=Aquiflexum sp. TKW24L TaxID=2942212 RepID=UPI0020BFEC4D|nr:agmatine deiminase family protein [Aquiflexum sp. TKW24L]MCL6260211.1 agmatine deiminase family protein [Aquiflexum sp. TKW24L]